MTNMTDFEDNYSTFVKCIMDVSSCKHTIANIIDIIELHHIFIICWTIGYKKLKPLK
jgi:hypothetical protein